MKVNNFFEVFFKFLPLLDVHEVVLLEDGAAVNTLEEAVEMILERVQFTVRPVLLDLVDLLVVEGDEIRDLVLAEHLCLPGFWETFCFPCVENTINHEIWEVNRNFKIF